MQWKKIYFVAHNLLVFSIILLFIAFKNRSLKKSFMQQQNSIINLFCSILLLLASPLHLFSCVKYIFSFDPERKLNEGENYFLYFARQFYLQQNNLMVCILNARHFGVVIKFDWSSRFQQIFFIATSSKMTANTQWKLLFDGFFCRNPILDCGHIFENAKHLKYRRGLSTNKRYLQKT